MTDNRKGRRAEKVHLHLDARPFSRVPVKPRARVLQSDVMKHIEPLGLDPENQERLLGGTLEILADYLGIQFTAEKTADHARALRALERIVVEGTKLAARLDELQSAYLVAIEANRREPRDELEPPKFDILQLSRKLHRLSHAAKRAREEFKANKRGSPPRATLDDAVARFRDLFREIGLEVSLHDSGSKVVNRRSLAGSGSAYLVGIFREFEKPTDETTIWGAWKRTLERDDCSLL